VEHNRQGQPLKISRFSDRAFEVSAMKKCVTLIVAAVTMAATIFALPATADAGRGWWAPAVIGGIAAGAIVGSALAAPYPYGYYAPAPLYYDYYTPAPTYYSFYGPPRYYGCWRWRHRYRYRVC
jgi:hypothetical protein